MSARLFLFWSAPVPGRSNAATRVASEYMRPEPGNVAAPEDGRTPRALSCQISAESVEGTMQRSLVMTVIGEDKPGLVESIATLVAGHGGNWLESRMSRLGGQFAGIVRVEVPADKEQPLANALKNLAARG